MSKYQDTMYNRFERVKSAVYSWQSMTIIFKLSHAHSLEKLGKIWDSKDFRKLNPSYRGRIDGHIDTYSNEFYKYMFWGFELSSGEVVPMKGIEKYFSEGHRDLSWQYITDHPEKAHYYWNEPNRDGKFIAYS